MGAAGAVPRLSGCGVSTIIKSIRVERSLEDIADLLGSRPPDWLVAFASIAVHTGDAAGARRTGVLKQSTSRRVRRIAIDLTDVPQNDDASRIDAGLVWETSGFDRMFTRFEGRIVAARDTDFSCIVTVEGSYSIPRSSGDTDPDAVAAAADTAVSTLLSTLRDAVEEQARAGV
jgi:hypothetical protein